MNNNGLSGYFDVDVKSNAEFSLKREKDSNRKSETLDLIEIESNKIEHLYFRRWIILFLFFIVSILNSFHLNLYSDIQTVIVSIYKPGSLIDKSSQYNSVNWLSIIQLVTNIIFIVPAILINQCFGFRSLCIFGVSLNCIGCWIKYASIRPAIFEILFFSQIVCGISQAFITICLFRISALWFSRNEVATSLSIGIMSTKCGMLISFLIMPYLITKKNSIYQNELYFNIIYLSVAILSSLILVISLLLVKEQPTKSPSLAQTEIRKREKTDSSKSKLEKFQNNWILFLQILSKRNFITLLISSSLINGTSYSISFLLNQILYASFYQEDSSRIGLIELFFIISSIIGSLISGLLLDNIKSFKTLAVASYSLCFVSILIFCVTLDFDIWFPFFSSFLIGLFAGSYAPVSYEYAIENTYPISEAISCGFLVIFSSFTGLLLTYVQGILILKFGIFYGNLLLCIVNLTGLIMTTTLDISYKREQVYETKNENSEHEHDNNQGLSMKKLRN